MLAGNRAAAALRGLPCLVQRPARAAPLAVVGGGASAGLLLDSILAWPGEIMAINGAHDWLRAARVPDYHLVLDPQPLCAGFVARPSRLTEYLIADTVDAAVLDALDGQRVTLWQLQQDEEDGAVLQGGVPGGPSAMTRAPVLAAALGYREIHLFGADCCFAGGGAHVYDRLPPGWWCLVACDGRLWRTQPQLLLQAAFLAESLPAMNAAGLEVVLRGADHLAAAMLRTGGRWFDALAGATLEPACLTEAP
ncbi:MAG: hypothetical protein RIB84_15785 [Sneathiellaceae bacterium]